LPISQNVTFSGVAPPDVEWPHPPGASIARLLREGVKQNGWAPDELDNWRDVGWSIRCQRASCELQVAFSACGTEQWMLQVAPNSIPGLLRRVLGRQPSANANDCLALAVVVHETLSRAGYSEFRWEWDGPPTNASSSRPTPPA
jgi:hypothetical protein